MLIYKQHWVIVAYSDGCEGKHSDARQNKVSDHNNDPSHLVSIFGQLWDLFRRRLSTFSNSTRQNYLPGNLLTGIHKLHTECWVCRQRERQNDTRNPPLRSRWQLDWPINWNICLRNFVCRHWYLALKCHPQLLCPWRTRCFPPPTSTT